MWVSFILAFCVVSNSFAAAEQRSNKESDLLSSPQIISFCDLAKSSIDLQKEVRVRAIYRVGFEWSELYSLKCQSAPTVWVDFSDDWKSRTRRAVRKEIDKDDGGMFGVILRGKLSSGGGFGHMGAYQMKFEVISVESAKRLDKRSFHSGTLTPDMRHRVEEFEAKP